MKLGQTSLNNILHFYAMDQIPFNTIIRSNNDAICKWCTEQFGSEQENMSQTRWSLLYDVILFENFDDYTLFLLTWDRDD
jgi:hypothetical protein